MSEHDVLLQRLGLEGIMAETIGRPEVSIGLIDGPVYLDHPMLASASIHSISPSLPAACGSRESLACVHGTFVAGILVSPRGSRAPAICPGCTLLVRPIFGESPLKGDYMPSATPDRLAQAVVDLVREGARIINISAALISSSAHHEASVSAALDYAARMGAIVVAAGGNESIVGSSAVTRHPWVVPVAAYGVDGRPMPGSNLGHSLGSRGVGAFGEGIASIESAPAPRRMLGTSIATPLVTGAIALLSSLFPKANVTNLKQAILQRTSGLPRSIVPPLLDAKKACEFLAGSC